MHQPGLAVVLHTDYHLPGEVADFFRVCGGSTGRACISRRCISANLHRKWFDRQGTKPTSRHPMQYRVPMTHRRQSKKKVKGVVVK